MMSHGDQERKSWTFVQQQALIRPALQCIWIFANSSAMNLDFFGQAVTGRAEMFGLPALALAGREQIVRAPSFPERSLPLESG